jgi:hypothetical protein
VPGAELSRRVENVVGYPPLSEIDRAQRREFHQALLDAEGQRRIRMSAKPVDDKLASVSQ